MATLIVFLASWEDLTQKRPLDGGSDGEGYGPGSHKGTLASLHPLAKEKSALLENFVYRYLYGDKWR